MNHHLQYFSYRSKYIEIFLGHLVKLYYRWTITFSIFHVNLDIKKLFSNTVKLYYLCTTPFTIFHINPDINILLSEIIYRSVRIIQHVRRSTFDEFLCACYFKKRRYIYKRERRKRRRKRDVKRRGKKENR
jgi:hypothetical protein